MSVMNVPMLQTPLAVRPVAETPAPAKAGPNLLTLALAAAGVIVIVKVLS